VKRPVFLRLDEVLALEADLVSRYGGAPGIRDLGLLDSALAMAQTTFAGQYLHASLPEMAAAYLFHLVSNHPFLDGNKRIGLLGAIVFLRLNGLRLVAEPKALTELVIAVASGKASKAQVAVFLAKNVEPWV
jgi:death-on-curing protein